MAIGLASISPEHPNSCMDDVTGEAHPVDTTWSLADTCGQAACMQRQDILYVTYESCGSAAAEPPCYIVYNTSASYPDCCGKVVCDSVEGNEIDVDEYGHYDEYMMSTNDAPNFLMAMVEDGSSSSRSNSFQQLHNKLPVAVDFEAAKKQQKLSLLTKLSPSAAAPHHDVTNDQLTIILPSSYYLSDSHEATTTTAKKGYGPGAASRHSGDTIDYDIELPKPMKSATLFDYHEVSIEDYDWDRIFGEAALQATH